jgi:hypothetical protein
LGAKKKKKKQKRKKEKPSSGGGKSDSASDSQEIKVTNLSLPSCSAPISNQALCTCGDLTGFDRFKQYGNSTTLS